MPTDLALANRAWESLMTAYTVLLRQFAAEDIWSDHGLSMREYDVLYTLSKFASGSQGALGAQGIRADQDSDAPELEHRAAEAKFAGARIGDLHRDVLLSQPALSRMVDRLAERGLVERVEDPTDGRAVRVQLSPAGRELQRSVGRAHARSVASAVSGALSDGEQRELSRLATALVERAGGSAPSISTAASTAQATQTVPSQTQAVRGEN